MNRTYFLLVNGEYYTEGDFPFVKNEALKIKKKAEKGFLLDGELIRTVEIAMFNISVFDEVYNEKN